MVVDGFEDMERDTQKEGNEEEEELEVKYGQFASESWKDYALSMRKLARID